jgi:hypothetical protein
VSWPGDVDPGAVVEPLVILAEQIVTVVAAVWRVDDAVNVIARWHDICRTRRQDGDRTR